jgi:large subunit ribosomal protein L21
MYAVIKSGSKQHKVSIGDVLSVEKLEGVKGTEVVINEVLLVADDQAVKIGKPFVEGAKVVGEIIEQKRGPKLIAYHMKKRKGFHKKTGHRQALTSMKIKSILI